MMNKIVEGLAAGKHLDGLLKQWHKYELYTENFNVCIAGVAKPG